MSVRIRLALHGCKNRPFYHIVVAPSRCKRDGRHLEQVGSYDPMPNYSNEALVGLNIDRIKYWLSVGAHPTMAVTKLLSLAGLIPIHPRLYLEADRKRSKVTSAAPPTSDSDSDSSGTDSDSSGSDSEGNKTQ